MEGKINHGDIYYAELDGNIGSEQGGFRPVICIQCEQLNRKSPTVVVVPITTKEKQKQITHYYVPKGTGGLLHDSCILTEQIRTIDKSRLKEYVGTMPPAMMKQIYKTVRYLIKGTDKKHKK